jgi:tetratricopeptide (TPR) repeat protein
MLPQLARGALYHSLRGYYHRVLGDAETGLHYAELAVAAVPDNWEVHDRRVRLLATLGRLEQAQAALAEAVRQDTLLLRSSRSIKLADLIEAARRGESIPAAPIDEVELTHERPR